MAKPRDLSAPSNDFWALRSQGKCSTTRERFYSEDQSGQGNGSALLSTATAASFSPEPAEESSYIVCNLATRQQLDLRNECMDTFTEDFAVLLGRPVRDVSHQCAERKELGRALWRASAGGKEGQAADLLLAGANPSARDSMGWTALHHAANAGRAALCALLLQFGAEPSARTSQKRTALHLACLCGHLEAAQILIAGATDIDARDSDGSTALHLVRFKPELTALLLRSGASVWILDNAGRVAFPAVEVPGDQPVRTASAPVLPLLSSAEATLADFALLGFLGQGEFGKVYLVEHRSSRRLFAMKVVTKAGRNGLDLVRYLETERDVLSRLDHPFIVRLHWAFQTSTNLFLVVDYCPGGDLNELIQKRGRLSEETARSLLCEIALAVEALHCENVIYRDLKPENIVLDADGHVRLTDFGLAKVGMTKSARTRSFCAPLAYSPPEMILQKGHGQAADWYMLGCVAFEMLVGVPPFHSHEEWKLLRKIEAHALELPALLSPEASDLILQLLDVDPERRLCGLEAVQAHAFFEGVDWDSVRCKLTPATQCHLKTPQSLHIHPVFDCASGSAATHLPGWSFCRV